MVIHQPEQQRFIIERQDHLAHLDYRLATDSVDFTLTWTPPALRGQGLAAQLVTAGVAWARQQNLRIEASCSYVAEWLRREAAEGRTP